MPRNSTVGVRRSALPQVGGVTVSSGLHPRVLLRAPMAARKAAGWDRRSGLLGSLPSSGSPSR